MASSDSQYETFTLPEPITEHLYEHVIDDSQSAGKRSDNLTNHQNSQICYLSLSESQSEQLQYEQLSLCDAAVAAAAAGTDTVSLSGFQFSENQDQGIDENWVKISVTSLRQKLSKQTVQNDDEYLSIDVSDSTKDDVSVLYSVSNAASDASILCQQSDDSQSANQTSSILYQVPPNNNMNNDDRQEYSEITTDDLIVYEEIENNENAVSMDSNIERARTVEINEKPYEIHINRFDTALSRSLRQRNLLTVFYLSFCLAKQSKHFDLLFSFKQLVKFKLSFD